MKVLFFSALISGMAVAAPCETNVRIEARLDLPMTCADLKEDQDLCKKGEALFHSKSLSADKQVSCASCHFSENLSDERSMPWLRGKVLPGSRTKGLRDIARRSGPYFWNGRASTLEGATFWPLYNKREIDADPKVLDAQGGDLLVAKSLALYLSTQNSAKAPIDRYLEGDCAALDKKAKRGLEIFAKENCDSCHQGSEMDSAALQIHSYENLAAGIFSRGEARYGQTWQLQAGRKKKVELRVKVPSLRNLLPPFGQFGQGKDLAAYLKGHAPRIHGSGADDLQYFLETSLRSSASLSQAKL